MPINLLKLIVQASFHAFSIRTNALCIHKEMLMIEQRFIYSSTRNLLLLTPATLTKIQHEREHADASRASGNEGKARVCARRAAGWAIAEAIPNAPIAAFAALKFAAHNKSLPADIQDAALQLTLRITQNHELPAQADALACADRIIDYCHAAS